MIRKLLIHANLILALMFLVFVILNYRNPRMGFLTSNISVWLLAAFVAVSVINCVIYIVEDHYRG